MVCYFSLEQIAIHFSWLVNWCFIFFHSVQTSSEFYIHCNNNNWFWWIDINSNFNIWEYLSIAIYWVYHCHCNIMNEYFSYELNWHNITLLYCCYQNIYFQEQTGQEGKLFTENHSNRWYSQRFTSVNTLAYY